MGCIEADGKRPEDHPWFMMAVMIMGYGLWVMGYGLWLLVGKLFLIINHPYQFVEQEQIL